APSPATIDTVTYGRTVICRSLMYASAITCSTAIRSPKNSPIAAPAATPVAIRAESDRPGLDAACAGPSKVVTTASNSAGNPVLGHQCRHVIVGSRCHRQVHERSRFGVGRFSRREHFRNGALLERIGQPVRAHEDDVLVREFEAF